MLKKGILAVIPARGGSKSIPRKNIKPLGGMPLLAYSVAVGLETEAIDRVIVSTDDEEIAAIARQWGAEVPFIRPRELAEDDTPDWPVFYHALQWLEENEAYRPDVIVQLRPTSPFRRVAHIEEMIDILIRHPDADSVRSVSSPSENPFKMYAVNENELLRPLLQGQGDEFYNMPRQKLPDVFWHNGNIDVIHWKTIMELESMSGDRILPYVQDSRHLVDIDTEAEWERAEWLLHRVEAAYLPVAQPSTVLPDDVRLLVLDFDGVLTDNRVWVDENGREQVACYRSDGTGLTLLQEKGINVFVLSKEVNPVVGARCQKLRLPYRQGIDNKVPVLDDILRGRELAWNQIVYVGNDINDLECMRRAGCGVAVRDAHPDVLAEADLILSRAGGRGAVREICDEILQYLERRDGSD